MRSKTSKRSPNLPVPWKVASGCSESALTAIAAEFARELKPGDRVLLEGVMGAGKSTFARAVIEALGVRQPAEGSPTFAIAHEYSGPRGEVIHIDLYRLKSEGEIEEAGIPAYFWEREPIVLIEWSSLWPEFESTIRRGEEGRRAWAVNLKISLGAEARDVEILRLPSGSSAT